MLHNFFITFYILYESLKRNDNKCKHEDIVFKIN